MRSASGLSHAAFCAGGVGGVLNRDVRESELGFGVLFLVDGTDFGDPVPVEFDVPGTNEFPQIVLYRLKRGRVPTDARFGAGVEEHADDLQLIVIGLELIGRGAASASSGCPCCRRPCPRRVSSGGRLEFGIRLVGGLLLRLGARPAVTGGTRARSRDSECGETERRELDRGMSSSRRSVTGVRGFRETIPGGRRFIHRR